MLSLDFYFFSQIKIHSFPHKFFEKEIKGYN